MRRILPLLLGVALIAPPTRDAMGLSGEAPATAASEADPGRAACEYGIAVAFHGDLARAESVFVGLLARSPGDARALANLGNLNVMRGESDVAMAFYERAAAADTADAGIILDQAIALLLLGEDETAAERAADGTARAGGVGEAARLLGLRTVPEDETPKGADKARVNPEEILTLLRQSASRVPVDSLRAGAGGKPAEDARKRDGRARPAPVWRAAGARAGDQDVAAVLYWKR